MLQLRGTDVAGIVGQFANGTQFVGRCSDFQSLFGSTHAHVVPQIAPSNEAHAQPSTTMADNVRAARIAALR